MLKPKKGYIVGVGSRLENFQTGLDVIGMTEIPFVSQGADLASGVISLATGDYVGAALSVGSLVPGLGQATGALKMARRAEKVVDAASNIKSAAKQTDNLLETTGKSRGIKTAPAPKKQPIGKKVEVDARPAKKEKMSEKEDVKLNDTPQDLEAQKKLDIWDNGTPYSPKGQGLEESIAKSNNPNTNISKGVQKDNYLKLEGHIEYRKFLNNPTNGMGKTPFGI